MNREQSKGRPHPALLFAFPFRIFFLSCALAGAILVPIWLIMLYHGASGLALPPLYWHQHEMTVGFLNAAIAGFMLTAICNWTGTPPVAGRRLLALWLLWLAGRLAMGFGGPWPVLAQTVDLLFLPVVAAVIALRVARARQLRQAPLVLVLLLCWGFDLAFHGSGDPRFLRALVLLAALLILLIGGRITPAFSANWLRQNGLDAGRVRRRPLVDGLALAALLLLVLLEASAVTRAWVIAPLALLATILIVLRLQGWFTRPLFREPLLWVLYLGQLWVAFGCLLRALAALSWLPPTAWVHALGAGAMATMILGVMTRVTVGHTGRALVLRPGGGWCYGLIIAAGAVRLLTALGGLPMQAGLWASGALWALAFVVFLLVYGPLLAAPRADGRPG